MKKILLLFVFMVYVMRVLSQDTTNVRLRKVKIADIMSQIGFYYQGYNCNLEDFKILAPHSILLEDARSANLEYHSVNDIKSDDAIVPNSGSTLTMKLGINFLNRKKMKYCNVQLRAGLIYFTNNIFSYELYETKQIRYDTIGTGSSAVYMDSLIKTKYQFHHDWKQLNGDLSLIFSIRPKGFVSFGAGVGISSGLTFNATTSIQFIKSSNRRGISESKPTYYLWDENGESKSEKFKNKNGINCFIYIPLEININFRSKNHPFWRKIHFYSGVMPGLSFVTLSDHAAISGYQVPIMVGFRFSL
jgi:hypothetical protein